LDSSNCRALHFPARPTFPAKIELAAAIGLRCSAQSRAALSGLRGFANFIAMKHLLPAIIVLGLIAMLFTSGCAYDGEGTGFTQRDLELQRKQAERSRGF
jgi:uncharacterized membrane protein SpoIIM required for sporulation